MKLEIGKIYKVDYESKLYGKDSFIGIYEGIAEDKYQSLPCVVCGADNHKRAYQFNAYFDLEHDGYETYNIGTSCIKKCIITESTKEEMIK